MGINGTKSHLSIMHTWVLKGQSYFSVYKGQSLGKKKTAWLYPYMGIAKQIWNKGEIYIQFFFSHYMAKGFWITDHPILRFITHSMWIPFQIIAFNVSVGRYY